MFGGLALTRDNRSIVATQHRRLALLAVVAVSRGRGVSRDKLLGYLWPEGQPDSARHSLEQLVYGLRREVGESVFLDGNPMRLNPEVVLSDIEAREQSLERGAVEDAAKVYGGPFLDGFFLSDSPEFERWVATERGRLAEQQASLLEKLATDAQGQQEPDRAVDWWRKRAALDPLSARGALGLMRSLAESGDRAGALQHARVYEMLLQQELQSTPDPTIAAFVEDLRAMPAAEAVRSISPPEGYRGLRTEPPNAEAAVVSPSPGLAPSTYRTLARRWANRWSPLTRVIAALVLVIPLVLAGVWVRRVSTAAESDRPRPDPNRVVVLPFRVAAADSPLAYLREGMVDLLAAKLTRDGGPASVDSRSTINAWRRTVGGSGAEVSKDAALRVALALGAGQALIGEAVRSGNNRLVLNGTLLSVSEGNVRSHRSVSGSVDSVPWLVDRLAAALLADEAGEQEDRIAALTRTTLPAIHAYLSGRAAYRRGDFDAAAAHHMRALALDSTFGLAALELASAAGSSFKLRPVEQAAVDQGWYAEVDSAWRRGIEVAGTQQQSLSGRDRAYLTTVRGTRYPLSSSALEQLRGWDHLVQSAPNRADSWYQLGYVLLYQGPSLGLSDAHARAAAAFERAIALDSAFLPPVTGLLEIAAFAGNVLEARRRGARYLASNPSGEIADYIRWRIGTVSDDSAAIRSLRARFASISTQSLARIQWVSQVAGIALDDADSAVAALLRRSGSRVDRARAIVMAQTLALNRGRPREFTQLLDTILDVQETAYRNRRFRVLYDLFWDVTGIGAPAARQIEESAAAVLSADPAIQSVPVLGDLFVAAQWRLWRGDTVQVSRAVDLLRRAAVKDSWFGSRVVLLDALLASVARRPDAPALMNRVDSLALQGCCESTHYANLVLARLRERAGDALGALKGVRRARWYFPPEYLSSSLREEGRLAALTGDRQGAIRAYRHYLTLRSTPEPAMRREVEHIRSELARLEKLQGRRP